MVAILITTVLFVYFVLIHFIFNKKKAKIERESVRVREKERETIALGKSGYQTKYTHERTHGHAEKEK